MAQQQSTKDTLTKKFDVNEDVPSRESLTSDQDRAQSWSAAGDASGHSTSSAGADDSSDTMMASESATDGQADSDRQSSARSPSAATSSSATAQSSSGDAIDTLRTSVVGVLDSMVREYEPQINEFTTNVAHQIVDRGVDIAQNAVQRVRAQSWLRLGIAAALGIGIVAVLGYEAEQAATAAPRARKPLH